MNDQQSAIERSTEERDPCKALGVGCAYRQAGASEVWKTKLVHIK